MSKGRTLEKVYGSGYFAFMLIVFTALTNLGYLLLNYSLAILLWDSSFYYSCAVGFSGKFEDRNLRTAFTSEFQNLKPWTNPPIIPTQALCSHWKWSPPAYWRAVLVLARPWPSGAFGLSCFTSVSSHLTLHSSVIWLEFWSAFSTQKVRCNRSWWTFGVSSCSGSFFLIPRESTFLLVRAILLCSFSQHTSNAAALPHRRCDVDLELSKSTESAAKRRLLRRVGAVQTTTAACLRGPVLPKKTRIQHVFLVERCQESGPLLRDLFIKKFTSGNLAALCPLRIITRMVQLCFNQFKMRRVLSL